jgi:predicted P-loop ATPase
VTCGTIDIDALKRDRNQLLAEAVDRYRHGEQWWPDPEFEREHIRKEQDARFEEDPWQQPIAAWLAHKNKVTVYDVIHFALGKDKSMIVTSDRNRTTAVLERLGWKRGPRGDARCWVRAQDNSPVAPTVAPHTPIIPLMRLN